MIRDSIKFKVGFYMVIALTIAVILFTYMMIRNNRQVLLEQANSHATQLSDMFLRSSRFAMLADEPAYVRDIVRNVAALEDIDKVRILSKDGRVIFSSLEEEVGTLVDQEAESCVGCHMDEQSMKDSPLIGRPRFFTSGEGERMMGSTAVIRNEPTCSNAPCHAHPADGLVLGVLDIVTPLDRIDATIQKNALTIMALSIGFVMLAAVLVSILVQRIIYTPLNDLKKGASRLAEGDLDRYIPVRSNDELGQLAESFNIMTDARRRSRNKLQQWGSTLEQKVKEATQELQVAQAETARSEKLASVGLLAAGIAHELNNPLTGVLTFSHLVRSQLADDSPEAEDLDLVIQETRRCAAIIRRLLDFAREKTPEKNFTDINLMIRETTQLISQSALLADIEVVVDLEDNLPQVWADADLIKQVFMNMLVNAQHAIGRNGSITVRTLLHDDQPSGIGDPNEPQAMVEISIRDTGCGISEENVQKIFDPFFTTKSVGKGTGLGLSVSHGTIAAHGGAIEVDSAVGVGTEFRVYLPVAKGGENNSGVSK